MTWNAPVLLDFAVALLLLAGLALAYRVLRRSLPGTSLAPQLLGALFGLIAVLQMHMPLEPVDGMIVDMRSVPIALAGAFLGVRGVVIAMLFACAARFGIGGVGWVSGVVAIMVNGGMGLLWNTITPGQQRRGLSALAVLGAMSSLSLLSVVLLPVDLAVWFIGQAAPVIILLNLVAIPLIGRLLERERIAMKYEARLRALEQLDQDAMFQGPEALARDLAHAESAGAYRLGLSVLGVRLRGGSIRSSLWGAEAEISILHEMRRRLEEVLPRQTPMGMVRDDIILIFLPSMPDDEVDALQEALRDGICSHAFDIPGMAPVRLRIDISSARFEGIPSYGRALSRLGWTSERVREHKPAADAGVALAAGRSDIARLFRTTDRLFEACDVDRRLRRRQT